MKTLEDLLKLEFEIVLDEKCVKIDENLPDVRYRLVMVSRVGNVQEYVIIDSYENIVFASRWIGSACKKFHSL